MLMSNDSLIGRSPTVNASLAGSLAASGSRPLDDEVGFAHLDAYFQREAAKQLLADQCDVADDKLLGRLVDFGFTVETLPALQLAPIAFMAWASTSVTEEESKAIVSAMYETDLFKHPTAVAVIQNWVDQQPTEELWDLWRDFTNESLSQLTILEQDSMAQRLLRQATQIALASGGFAGLGSVCAAENEILDRIRSVFYERRQGTLRI